MPSTYICSSYCFTVIGCWTRVYLRPKAWYDLIVGTKQMACNLVSKKVFHYLFKFFVLTWFVVIDKTEKHSVFWEFFGYNLVRMTEKAPVSIVQKTFFGVITEICLHFSFLSVISCHFYWQLSGSDTSNYFKSNCILQFFYFCYCLF